MAQSAKQVDVARAAGISPSYLALIEKGRRPIGGALLSRLADVLGVDRAALSEDSDAALVGVLATAAGEKGMAANDQAQAAELARRFPAWAQLTADLAAERERDRGRIATLSDRLTHDPALADAMHELLSTVASVRSTAAILAQTPELEPAWLDRFHTNLDTESRRLASGAEAVVSYFDGQAEAEANLIPVEAAALFLEHAGREPGADIDAQIAELPAQARDVVRGVLARDEADAAALPSLELDNPPEAIAQATDAPMAQVLRRIAALDPARGLVVCDAAGALTRRRAVAGFALPVIGAGCPLWPLYAAMSRPLHPITCHLETPDGAIWLAHAATEVVAQTPHGPVVEATMLLTRATQAPTTWAVGPGCRVCPRDACPARREPSLLTGAV